jgi:DNA-binding transcriptional LysR family regulator
LKALHCGSQLPRPSHSVQEAARRGGGLAYVFQQLAARELGSGELVPLLEKFSTAGETFHVYYPARTMMPGKLRAFLEFMRAATF